MNTIICRTSREQNEPLPFNHALNFKLPAKLIHMSKSIKPSPNRHNAVFVLSDKSLCLFGDETNEMNVDFMSTKGTYQ